MHFTLQWSLLSYKCVYCCHINQSFQNFELDTGWKTNNQSLLDLIVNFPIMLYFYPASVSILTMFYPPVSLKRITVSSFSVMSVCPHLFRDRFRTMVNVMGDALATGIMAHICRKDFIKEGDGVSYLRENTTDKLTNNLFYLN